MTGVGVIGVGTISDKHLEAYFMFKDRCRILALCDRNKENALAVKVKYHLDDAKIYTDYDDMLKMDDLKLVSVCTPPFTHAACAIACMQAGKHVLVEKPMAASLEECDEMLRVQESTGKYLGVISQNRYVQELAGLHSLLTGGIAGKVLFGQAESFWYRGYPYYDKQWRGSWETEGGGCTLNHGVHQIDLLNWMMGAPRLVTAVLGNVAHGNAEIEDVSAAILVYDSGAMVTLSTSLVTHGEGQRLVFQCEKASLAYPWNAESSRSDPVGFPENNSVFAKKIREAFKELPRLPYTGHAGQIHRVLSFLETGVLPGEDGRDGRQALEIITAIYYSGFTGQTVSLPLSKDNPYYTKEGRLSHVHRFHDIK